MLSARFLNLLFYPLLLALLTCLFILAYPLHTLWYATALFALGITIGARIQRFHDLEYMIDTSQTVDGIQEDINKRLDELKRDVRARNVGNTGETDDGGATPTQSAIWGRNNEEVENLRVWSEVAEEVLRIRRWHPGVMEWFDFYVGWLVWRLRWYLGDRITERLGWESD